jgi:low affinity Fe/Cu permease
MFRRLRSVFHAEDQNAFNTLFNRLQSEHQPATVTEEILVEKMAQHYWLTQRALALQGTCFNSETAPEDPEKQLALYLRYQTTHDRAFHKSLDKLLKLRAEKRRQEIGFESQQRKQDEEIRRRNREERRQNDELRKVADQTRRESAENRKQELHRYNVMLGEAKFDHQRLQNITLERAHLLATTTDEEFDLEEEEAA